MVYYAFPMKRFLPSLLLNPTRNIATLSVAGTLCHNFYYRVCLSGLESKGGK